MDVVTHIPSIVPHYIDIYIYINTLLPARTPKSAFLTSVDLNETVIYVALVSDIGMI